MKRPITWRESKNEKWAKHVSTVIKIEKCPVHSTHPSKNPTSAVFF